MPVLPMGGRHTCQMSCRHVWRRPDASICSTPLAAKKRFSEQAQNCKPHTVTIRVDASPLFRMIIAALVIDASTKISASELRRRCSGLLWCLGSPPPRRGRRGPRGTAGPSTLPPRLARTASWRSTRWREPLAAARPRRHRRALGGPLAGAAPRRRLERLAALERQRKERQTATPPPRGIKSNAPSTQVYT